MLAKSFWGKAERAGESFELGVRVILGLIFAFLLGGAAWAIGTYVWIGISIVLAIPAALIGFTAGFFWVEIKLLIDW
ncbi:MAG: hypothetical protein AAGA25_13650 [Planctomycetota bacterium]